MMNIKNALCFNLVICAISVLLLSPKLAKAQTSGNGVQATIPKVEIPNTELRHLKSTVRGQDYDVYIHLPGNYNNADSIYPVIYLLDAQWDFPLLTAVYGQQYYDGFLPGVMLVGITWGGENPDYDALRAGDFTPTHLDRAPLSGKANDFLAFIKRELIPFVESHYRAGKDRTLMGSSLGGLFTLYALFEEPALFHRYVLTSPAVGWDNYIIYQYEKDYAKNTSRPLVKLYMAEGGLEGGVDDFLKLADHLKAKNNPGMEVQTRVLEGMGHSGGKAEGYTRGLQAVFKRPSMRLAEEVLKRYAGVYQSEAGIRLKIEREDEHLVLRYSGNSTYVLHAETDKDFYYTGELLNIHFAENGEGDITGLQLDRFNGSDSFQRMNQ